MGVRKVCLSVKGVDKTAGLHLAHEGIIEKSPWVHLFGFRVS